MKTQENKFSKVEPILHRNTQIFQFNCTHLEVKFHKISARPKTHSNPDPKKRGLKLITIIQSLDMCEREESTYSTHKGVFYERGLNAYSTRINIRSSPSLPPSRLSLSLSLLSPSRSTRCPIALSLKSLSLSQLALSNRSLSRRNPNFHLPYSPADLIPNLSAFNSPSNMAPECLRHHPYAAPMTPSPPPPPLPLRRRRRRIDDDDDVRPVNLLRVFNLAWLDEEAEFLALLVAREQEKQAREWPLRQLRVLRSHR